MFIAGIVIASLSYSAAAPDEQPAPKSENIAELLKERVAVLKSKHDHAVSGYDNGVCSFEQVHITRVEYLNARLDACTDRDERIAILKESLDDAKAFHKAARERIEATTGNMIEELAAKAYVLEARIALARAQQAK